MAEKSRIRLNPTTKVIEIEGAEKFVRENFDVIYKMMIGTGKLAKEPAQKVAKATSAKNSAAQTKKSSETSASSWISSRRAREESPRRNWRRKRV